MTGRRWLNWAALVTWLVASLPTAVDVIAGRVAAPLTIIWTIAALLFGVLLVASLAPWRAGRALSHPRLAAPSDPPTLAPSHLDVQRSRHSSAPDAPRRIALLLLQSLCGLAMVWVRPQGAAAATVVIVAAQLPYVVPPAGAWSWVFAQTIALALIFLSVAGFVDSLAVAAAFGGFQMFAVATSMLALSERRSREALARANAELTATRERLADNTRTAERLRISRDLHDTLGHHLTALSLQLDVASRLTSGAAATHVLEAHAIARLLLGDVRAVVSEIRERVPIDLPAALRRFEGKTGSLCVHIDAPETLVLDDSMHAHAILHSVQEIVTNAVRHASAANLWISLRRSDAGVAIDARDDGCGAATPAPGNGLKGMRERFEAHAGRVEFVTAAGRGFQVHGFIPTRERVR